MTPQELKNSILKLAIQGKLVEQRPEEGTAEELFARIQKEKLIAEKKIKKEKPLPEITDDEKPFDIPDSWKFIRIANICQLLDGEKIKGANFPYLEAKYLRGKSEPKILNEGKFIKQGTKVILVDGENSGEVFNVPENGYMGSTFKVLFVPANVCVEYVLIFLEIHKNKLKNNKKGAAIPHLNKEIFFNLLFPLPPLAEQKRIVAKIEELLPYIYRYEQAWSKLEQFNIRFPEDMKKSLLQYAIQGKLVEQRPEEGTAEELFAQIQKEKQKLIAEKKIKKEKTLPEITDDEKPFDIPESWKWVRFSELCSVLTCGYASTPTYVDKESGKPFISAKNVKPNKFMPEDHKYISCELYEKLTQNAKPEKGDILLTRVGAGIGEAAIIDIEFDFAIYVSLTLIKLVDINLVNNQFILYWLNSPIGVSSAQKNIYGKNASQGNLNVKNVRDFLVPLPPIAEQKRIVEKLEQILPLCKRLI